MSHPTPRVRSLAVTPFARVFDVHCMGHDSRAEEFAATHELVLVRRGVFAWRDARGRAVADANRALVAPRGAAYTVTHPAGGGDRSTVIAFDGDVDMRLALRVVPPAFHLLHRRLALAPPRGALAREELVARLLALALAPPVPARAGVRRATRLAHAALADHVRALLAADPARAWSLASLARHAATSPYHLCRVFKDQVGLPVHRYHLRLRLLVALERWCADGDDLTAAALAAGFASHSHFTAAFHAEFGAPPTRALGRQTSKILKATGRAAR